MKAASTIGEPQPDSPMNRIISRRLTTFAAGTLLILAGCSDAVAPAPTPATKPDAGQPEALLGLNIPLIDNLLGIGDTVVVLQRATPLPSDITVTQVIVLQVIQGVINAFDTPARQAFVVEMVERADDLPNAIALNSAMMNAARFIGPLLGGALIAALGEPWGFGVNVLTYMVMLWALLQMRVTPRGG